MADIEINYQVVQVSAAKLDAGREKLEEQLQQLAREIDSLTTEQYRTREASGRFKEGYLEWQKGANHLVSSLTGMSRYLHRVMNEYADLDTSQGGAAQP
jgi:WXG100 family type VII secretion target